MGTVSLPTGAANTGTNDWSDVYNNDAAIVNEVNGNIVNANVGSGAAIAYSKLASMSTGAVLLGNAGTPTATTLSGDVTVGATGVTAIGATKVTAAMLNADTQAGYRTILNASGYLDDGSSPTTYALGTNFSGDSGMNTAGGTINIETSSEISHPAPLIYIDDADYTLASLTPKLRIRAQVLCNATAPGTITFTFGLYPITCAGAADVITLTYGTVVSNSTVAIVNPSASTVNQDKNTDFAFPSDGVYALGVATSAVAASNTATLCSAQLQVRLT